MFSDRVFQITFLISLVVHGVFLFRSPNFNLFPTEKKEQKLEVRYLEKVQEDKPIENPRPPTKKEPFLEMVSKIIAKKKIPPPYIDKEDIFKQGMRTGSQQSELDKPVLKPDIIAVKKKITLPPLGINKIKNPSYISYYQIVREKIKRAAYQNYTQTEVGNVYLSFIISSDGYLKEVRLKEEKSSSSPYLRAIALRSIKDASPFPNFPKRLNYPQLSFNVVISFEIE